MMNSIATAGIMEQRTKLLLGLQQIDNLTSLLEGNEYQSFLYSHLISIKVELRRQLANELHKERTQTDLSCSEELS